jgi:hypothetical protein
MRKILDLNEVGEGEREKATLEVMAEILKHLEEKTK